MVMFSASEVIHGTAAPLNAWAWMNRDKGQNDKSKKPGLGKQRLSQ